MAAIALAAVLFRSHKTSVAPPEEAAPAGAPPQDSEPSSGGPSRAEEPNGGFRPEPYKSAPDVHPGAMMLAEKQLERVLAPKTEPGRDHAPVYDLAKTVLLLSPGEQESLFSAAALKYPDRGAELALFKAFAHSQDGDCRKAAADLERTPEPSDPFWKDVIEEIRSECRPAGARR